jgi:hypothetical protein
MSPRANRTLGKRGLVVDDFESVNPAPPDEILMTPPATAVIW